MKLNSQFVSLSILLCILAFGSSVYAQTKKEITENEYWQAIRDAEDTKGKARYRSTSIEEIYKNGKVIGTRKTVNEQVSADVTRLVYEHKHEGKSETNEVIQIGTSFFCKENSGPWKKSARWCGPSTARTIPAENESQFTLDETKLDGRNVKLYAMKAVFEGFEGRRQFSEGKSWINISGEPVREENMYGFEKDGEITSKEMVTYEYNPKDLKIVAPIK